MDDYERDLYKEALIKKGADLQFIIAIEENMEMAHAITKFMRMSERLYDKEILFNDLCEEIADVEIMCGQMRVTLNADKDIDNFKELKLQRLRDRLDKISREG